MQLLSLNQLPSSFKKSVVTIGMFDGVHLAHQHIIKMVVNEALKIDAKSVVITFWPHPRMVITGKDDYKILSTLNEKIAEIEKCNIDYLLVIPFDKDFAEINAFDFLKKILIEGLKSNTIIIGYDHHFGKNREGNYEFLQKYRFDFQYNLIEINKQQISEATVSSTSIREYLQNGEIENANRLIGTKYAIYGKVIKGFQMGRKIGFPTANIEVDSNFKLIPAFGVYVVELDLNGKKYSGVMNIGNRPTFDGKNLSIEVNIFDFDQDIYGEQIKVSFLKRIREERKFETIDLLKAQIEKDISTAKAFILQNLEKNFQFSTQ